MAIHWPRPRENSAPSLPESHFRHWSRKEKIPHSFYDNGKDGLVPMGGLIFDASGNLYSTT